MLLIKNGNHYIAASGKVVQIYQYNILDNPPYRGRVKGDNGYILFYDNTGKCWSGEPEMDLISEYTMPVSANLIDVYQTKLDDAAEDIMAMLKLWKVDPKRIEQLNGKLDKLVDAAGKLQSAKVSVTMQAREGKPPTLPDTNNCC